VSLNSEQMSFQVALECGNALAQSKCQQDGAAYDICMNLTFTFFQVKK